MNPKHLIITGASKGIGYESALSLAEKGHTVTAISRSAAKLEELKSHYPEKIHPVPLDITNKDSGKTIREHLATFSLKIDGFVHNAGLLINKPFIELSDEEWIHQLDVNFLAPVRITRTLLSEFNSGSHIVCIGSMGGFQGSSKFPGLSAYSSSKGALAIFSECLAAELADHNISCNTLCLGAVQTEMLEEAFPGFKAPVEPGEMGSYIGEFTLSGHRFYNGQILPVTLGNPG